jgi:hypothetical protein
MADLFGCFVTRRIQQKSRIALSVARIVLESASDLRDRNIVRKLGFQILVVNRASGIKVNLCPSQSATTNLFHNP